MTAAPPAARRPGNARRAEGRHSGTATQAAARAALRLRRDRVLRVRSTRCGWAVRRPALRRSSRPGNCPSWRTSGTQYDDSRRTKCSRHGHKRLERALTRQTAALADGVIGNYRSPLPSVREAQWRMAREALARAIAVAPDERELKAALRYCDGHLHRINGEARKSRRQSHGGAAGIHRCRGRLPRGGRAETEVAGPVSRACTHVHLRPRRRRSRRRCVEAGAASRLHAHAARDRAACRWISRARRHAGAQRDGNSTACRRSATTYLAPSDVVSASARRCTAERRRVRQRAEVHPSHATQRSSKSSSASTSSITARRRKRGRLWRCRAESQRHPRVFPRRRHDVSYVPALERDVKHARLLVRRLDARHALLPLTSAVAMLAIGLAYSGRTQRSESASPRPSIEPSISTS